MRVRLSASAKPRPIKLVNTTNPTASSTVLVSDWSSWAVWNILTKFETPTKLNGPIPDQLVKA